MNIKSKDFLERLEISEQKNEKLVLLSLGLGLLSIELAFDKSILWLVYTYGFILGAIGLTSLITSIKEINFYKKMGNLKKMKVQIGIQIFLDLFIVIFGATMLFLPQILIWINN